MHSQDIFWFQIIMNHISPNILPINLLILCVLDQYWNFFWPKNILFQQKYHRYFFNHSVKAYIHVLRLAFYRKLLKILATVNTCIKYTLSFPVNQFNEIHNDWGYALSMLLLNWGIPKKKKGKLFKKVHPRLV